MVYRSLISIGSLSGKEVDSLLDLAEHFLPRIEQGGFKIPLLKGTSCILLFYEASTRTRVSFELAGKMLGSDTINISSTSSSATKGESLRDTALTLAAMDNNVVIMRHPAPDGVELFASWFDRAVINAGSGRGQHPTQALLDAFTIRKDGKFSRGKHVAIVGDIKHSRVMRSNITLMLDRGMDVTIVAPPTLIPEGWKALGFESSMAQSGGRLSWATSLDSVLAEVDVLMMLRMQRERMTGGHITNLDEYSKIYGLNASRLRQLKEDAMIMHPGPVNRGVEVSQAVFEDPRCKITNQVTAGLALRCALLCWACGLDLKQVETELNN